MEQSITAEASVTAKTHQAYCRLLKDFQRSEGLPHLGVAADVLDAKLVRYFDRLMLEGRDAGAGGKVLSAVQFWVPSFAHHGQLHLPRAHRSLRGWKRLMPGRTRRPLPWTVIAAIAWDLRMRGMWAWPCAGWPWSTATCGRVRLWRCW